MEKVNMPQIYDYIRSPIRQTAKQADYIIGLLKSIGITDDEFTGSITTLKTAIRRKSSVPMPDVDDNTLISWLRRGGINR